MELRSETSLSELPGIGPARAKALAKLGLNCAGDLLRQFPREYEDRTIYDSALALGPDVALSFRAMVTERFRASYVRRGMELCKGVISDGATRINVTFFNQSYVEKQLITGAEFVFYGKVERKGSVCAMTNPYFEPEGANRLVGGIVPIYPLTAGVSQNLVAGLHRRALPLAAEIKELLPAEILREYELAQSEFSYQNIHFPASWEALGLARNRLIFEELYCLSLGLQLLRARRTESGGIAFSDRDLSGFTKALPFSLTGAQKRAMREIAADLDSAQPMNRLLQGDVGSGKTVVAAAAAYQAFRNGHQAALMAPTELLARQHLHTMETLLAGTGMKLGLLLGSLTAKEKRQVKEAAALGEYDLLIGTHALISGDVDFQRLGLVITDEQHRFGVRQRATLAAKAAEAITPHVLVMSATPIPRTLALMIYGELDISVLDELPPGRTPVKTYVVGEDKRQRMYGFLRRQVNEGRQVYIVCPTVEEGGALELKAAQQFGESLRDEIFPDLTVAVIHGRMKPKDKQAVMAAFVADEVSILVSTTVIEVGVDVPNATVMVIENAERFGLSQLHQLRGRVGRGAHESHCILVSDNRGDTAAQRLRALAATNDGFRIAEEDLKLRGPGDFFGARQHGLPPLEIASLAGDMRVLKDAQEAATETLQRDPLLREERHAALRKRVEALFEENRDGFN